MKETKDKSKTEETRSLRSAKAVNKKARGVCMISFFFYFFFLFIFFYFSHILARSTSRMTISKKDAENSAVKNTQFTELENIDTHLLTPRSVFLKQIYEHGLSFLKTLYTFQVFFLTEEKRREEKRR